MILLYYNVLGVTDKISSDIMRPSILFHSLPEIYFNTFDKKA